MPTPASNPPAFSPTHPVRRALFRGLAVVLPPLLTLVIFLWIGGTLDLYILRPVTGAARWALVQTLADIRRELPPGSTAQPDGAWRDPAGKSWIALADGSYVPQPVHAAVLAQSVNEPPPQSGSALYGRWIELRYLRPYYVVPVLLAVVLGLMYLLGSTLAAGVGHMLWRGCERLIEQVPVVANIYAAVKQVTDYLFSDNELQFSRVVAVEYPRTGLWCVAFVTGEGFSQLRAALGEQLLAVFVPTSPMPFTGYTMNYRRADVVDLKMSLDEAFQYVISCGVVIPAERLAELASPAPVAAAAPSTAGTP